MGRTCYDTSMCVADWDQVTFSTLSSTSRVHSSTGSRWTDCSSNSCTATFSQMTSSRSKLSKNGYPTTITGRWLAAKELAGEFTATGVSLLWRNSKKSREKMEPASLCYEETRRNQEKMGSASTLVLFSAAPTTKKSIRSWAAEYKSWRIKRVKTWTHVGCGEGLVVINWQLTFVVTKLDWRPISFSGSIKDIKCWFLLKKNWNCCWWLGTLVEQCSVIHKRMAYRHQFSRLVDWYSGISL